MLIIKKCQLAFISKRKKVITTRELTGIKVNSRTNVYSNYALVIFILEDWSVK